MTEGIPYDPKLRYGSTYRREISLGSPEVMGLQIVSNGALSDPNTIGVNIYQEDDYDDSDPDGTLLATYTYGTDPELIREDVGVFSFVLQPELTSVKSLFRVSWHYTIGGHNFTYDDYYIVLERMPTYDALSDAEKSVVQQVTNMFGDLFDNTTGGQPYFAEEFQTHYGYERIAQLMYVAVQRINFTKQPVTNFRVGPLTSMGGSSFPTSGLGLVLLGTYLEVLKHLVRTYVEQPSISGANVSYADRRDYMQRWQSVLSEEKETYDDMLRMFKRSQMNLGGGRLIVSGGLYGGSGGRYGPMTPGFAALRGIPYYPQALVIGGGIYGH